MGTEKWGSGKYTSAVPASELRGGREKIWLRASEMATCELLAHTVIGESQEDDGEQRHQKQQCLLQKKPGILLYKGPENEYVRLLETDTLCHNYPSLLKWYESSHDSL